MNGPCTSCRRDSGDAKKGGGLWLPPDSEPVYIQGRQKGTKIWMWVARPHDNHNVLVATKAEATGYRAVAVWSVWHALEAVSSRNPDHEFQVEPRALCSDCRTDRDDGKSPWRSA